jgi:hypothetical protein
MKEWSEFGQAQKLFLWPYWTEKAISAQRIVSEVIDVIFGGFEYLAHNLGNRWMLGDLIKKVILSS